MVKLVAALGNPDLQYKNTRHNIAWQLLEYLPFIQELKWKNKFKGEYASLNQHSEKLHFLKPLTYMNLSGESVNLVMDFYNLQADGLLVIHDELEIDFGYVSLKDGGGLGGHNGLRSIEASIGTRDFKRMRLGISKPSHGNITPYVLGNFLPEEATVLPTFLEKSADLLSLVLNGQDLPKLFKQYRKYNTLPVID